MIKRRILVTGGAGYIGSHTCKALYKCGFEPVVLDNLSTGHKDFVKWGPLIVGDIRDYPLVSDLIRQYDPLAAIHFAASAYVGESVVNPMKYYQNNVLGSIGLIKALIDNGINKIVFSSTCATYGIPKSLLIDELCEQKPINPYGFSKLFVEQCLKDLSNSQLSRFVALRYFNAAGADEDLEVGEIHNPETHLIPLAIRSALEGSKLEVFGDDFETPDGSAVRDYIHVSDLGSAHVSALQYLINGGNSVCLNLGTGKGTSVFEILSALESIVGTLNYKVSNRREGDPAHLVADATKAIDMLRWAPKYKDIHQILRSAVNWHKKIGFNF